MHALRTPAALLLPFLFISLSGCGGGSAGAPVTPGKSAAASQVLATVRVSVPATTQASTSARRHSQFIVNSTKGILEQTYAQSDTNHTTLLGSTATDISSGSTACAGGTSPRTCTISFYAPGGADSFVLTTYDAAPVGGAFTGAHELAAASINQTITAGTANVVNAVLGGVVNSLALVVPHAQLSGTAASTQNVTVEAMDVNGNLILTDGYADAAGNPASIALTLTPNTGNVFSLGSASLASPAPAGVPLSYSGTAAAAFTTTLSATLGTIHTSAQIALQGPAFNEYTATTAVAAPSYLTTAPYSAQDYAHVWFTEYGANKIASIDLSGNVTEYPTAGTHPQGIAPGPLGNPYLWIACTGSSTIGVYDTTGVMYGNVSTTTPSASPLGITAGPDGNMWFTESATGKIGKITTSYTVTEYPVGIGGSSPQFIAAGPDGNLWFTDGGANAIGKVTTSGTVTEYPIPTSASSPNGITAGSDGNLWFVELSGNKVAKITTGGTITEYTIPTSNTQPRSIVAGADGNLWITESATGKIARVTLTGTVTEYAPPTLSNAEGIAVGPDNRLYFTETGANKVGVFAW